MYRARPLSISQQAIALRALWPGCHVAVQRETRIRRGRKRTTEFLIASGTLSATPITEEYEVRIEYRERENPKVFVDRPVLARRVEAPDVPIPHMYEANTPGAERPCIFLPGTDWDSTMAIARTILPWFRCWLLDYEVWRATGVWSGGGATHSGPKAEATSP